MIGIPWNIFTTNYRTLSETKLRDNWDNGIWISDKIENNSLNMQEHTQEWFQAFSFVTSQILTVKRSLFNVFSSTG